MTTSCPTCRTEAPQGARFCPACGARLEAERPEATERRVVTTLFADLVGFTALGERHDPEDVDAALRGYYALARSIIERFGGIVEKFIGDAVVGLFGIPLAHEDDAERAVRAALEIVAHMHELAPLGEEHLQVRAAVNTGPALVRLRVRPETGEGLLVGDAVNTAARLLAGAPPMAVVAGVASHRLTERLIAYEQLPAITAKGKSKPLHRWVARGVIARKGVDADQRDESPMVGREVELGILSGLLEKAIASATPRFALIVGEAGIGKSRLIRELLRVVDARPRLICIWRQGRCPPYGDSLAFGALRDIVWAHIGADTGDSPATIEEKLRRAVGVDEDDEWLLSRLRPLVGLPAMQTDRDSNFAAWLTLLEGIARSRPTVVVIEDLQWASEATVAFLEHLARSARDVPLLIVGTARPEFLDAQSGTSRYAEVLTRVDLTSLSREESVRLVAQLAGSRQQRNLTNVIAERCGGNPLFAEELVRYAKDAPEPESSNGTPESILALIAARLDTLPVNCKSILADAAVLGPVFRADAVAALGVRETADVEDALQRLEAREFVRRFRTSDRGIEDNFGFRHALTLEVAYGQLSRSSRATKHAAAGRWLENAGGGDPRAAADIIAHHFVTAVELAEESRNGTLAAQLRGAAVRVLELAGTQSLSLDVAVAERHYAKALQLAGDDPRRPYLLSELATALLVNGRFRDASTALDEGVVGLEEQGDDRAAKQAAARRWYAHWLLADGEESGLDVGAALPNGAEATPELVEIISNCADRAVFSGKSSLAIELADRALGMSRALGLPEPVRVIDDRGAARCDLGDAGGLEDLAHAIELARERGDGHAECASSSNMGECLNLFRGPAAAIRLHEKALQLARRRHDELAVCFCRQVLFTDRILSGQWDAAVAEMEELDCLLDKREDVWDLELNRAIAGLLLAWRGNTAAGEARAAWAEQRSAGTPNLKVRATCLVSLAGVRFHAGHEQEAVRLLRACEELPETRHMVDFALRVPEALRIAFRLGESSMAGRLASPLHITRPYDRGSLALLEAFREEHDGDYRSASLHFREAEAVWAELGVPFERAHAALAAGRCAAMLQETASASASLAAARDTFSALGAQPARLEAASLLESLGR